MIIDVNAHLGHYPFRRLRFTGASTMIEHMDSHGITAAVVTSLHSVFYRDAHRGNEELFHECRKFPGRLIPVATVNPTYAGWQRDLEQSVREWQTKAIGLFPSYHNYSLTDQHGQSVLRSAAEHNLPVVLTQRLEDRRQRHPWDQAEDISIEELSELAMAHPSVRFSLRNWSGLDGGQLLAAKLRGRCLIEFSRLQVLVSKDVPKLISTLGVDSIAFGSHMPFDYVGPSLVKLANLATLPAGDCEKIAWKNAAAFFQLDDVTGARPPQ
jgi:predicted TIM-barrel fold metal-dependent hydrolase